MSSVSHARLKIHESRKKNVFFPNETLINFETYDTKKLPVEKFEPGIEFLNNVNSGKSKLSCEKLFGASKSIHITFPNNSFQNGQFKFTTERQNIFP